VRGRSIAEAIILLIAGCKRTSDVNPIVLVIEVEVD
jgi:hypothetical protein